LVDYGVKLDVIDKSGAWFSYNDVKLGQGRENVKQRFKDEPELAAEVEAAIKVKMSKSTIMAMSNDDIAEHSSVDAE